MKSIGHIPDSEQNRFFDLLDRNKGWKTTIQLGISFLKFDHHAQRQYLLHELNKVINELGSTNGFKQAFDSIYASKETQIDLSFTEFRRYWIEDPDDGPGLGFIIEF